MNTRNVLAALLLAAAATSGVAPAAQAHGYVALSVGMAPPPPRYERVLVRPGYVWAPGGWRWRHARYVWTRGRWIVARPGWRYVPARWAPHGPRWVFRAGYWSR